MKTTAYILFVIMMAALTSCNDDEVSYVRQDQLAIKTFPIASLVCPRLLPDGSLITIVDDNTANNVTARNGELNPTSGAAIHALAFRFSKLTTDGTWTQSDGLSYNITTEDNRQRDNQLSVSDDTGDIDITSDGNVFFRYCLESTFLGVANLDGEIIINSDIKSLFDDNYIGSIALDDGSLAVIHGENPVISILDASGEWSQQISLSSIRCDENAHYKVYGLCGNIMIVGNDTQQDENMFYVFSPAGELLNSGSCNYNYDRIINITDPSSNTTYGYATISNAKIQTDDSDSEDGGFVIKLDSNGNVIFEYQTAELTDIFNITMHDGQLLVAGDYMSMSMDYLSNVNDMTKFMSTITGKIITLDAATGDEISVNTISLEGGVMPFAVVPDNNGGYYVYLARIMTSDVGMVGNNNSYGSSIYIYHTDDLNKLNIE